MILDASAILAILFEEPEHEAFLVKVDAAHAVGVGAPTLLECGIALASRPGVPARPRLEGFLGNGGVVVVSFGAIHWQVALDAWSRFGKSRHEARLNFGDCLAYATARVADRPLLTKDPGFAKTDLALA